MIDRAKIRKMKDAPPQWFASLGKGKPWRKSWFVLMGLVQAQTDQQFAELEPRFNRAYRDFGAWMAKLKQDPRQHEAGPDSARYFRDDEFTVAFKILMRYVGESRLFDSSTRPYQPTTRQHEIGQLISDLHARVMHFPKDGGIRSCTPQSQWI